VLAVILVDGCISHGQYANSDTCQRRGVQPCYDNTIQYELEKCNRVHIRYNARLPAEMNYYNIVIYRRTLTAKYYIVRTAECRERPNHNLDLWRAFSRLIVILVIQSFGKNRVRCIYILTWRIKACDDERRVCSNNRDAVNRDKRLQLHDDELSSELTKTKSW